MSLHSILHKERSRRWMDAMDRKRYGVWVIAPVAIVLMFAPFIVFGWIAVTFLKFVSPEIP